jgi:hypothetical protein
VELYLIYISLSFHIKECKLNTYIVKKLKIFIIENEELKHKLLLLEKENQELR